MKKENLIYDILVAVLLILPFCATLASAGTRDDALHTKTAPAVYTDDFSYAGTLTAMHHGLEEPAVDR